jgi:uncharacterized protein (TIGR00725 family)
LTTQRLPIVGVMGSGRHAQRECAARLGDWLAREGVHLLTGGGAGVMAAVSEAFHAVPGRRGRVIGILPAAADTDHAPKSHSSPDGYPNRWVEIPIHTHLPLSGARGRDPQSRNHINVLSSDVVVALPGGTGTASEVALALHYGKPVIAWLDDRSQIEGLPEAAKSARDFAVIRDFVLTNAFADRPAGAG